MVTYVLKLHNNKYYVGRTNNLNSRYTQHKNGFGAAWTKKYGVLSIFKTYEDDSPFYEDMVVKTMMHQYGIANVRGGSYSMLRLSDTQLGLLQAEIRGATDCCFKCGGNHFIKYCAYKDTPVVWDSISDFAAQVCDSICLNVTKSFDYISSFWN